MTLALTNRLTLRDAITYASQTHFTRTRVVTTLDLLQWSAMATTLVAAWAVGSSHRPRRFGGFLVFLLSNGMWAAWAIHVHAWALLTLQCGLAVMNLRGLVRHQRARRSSLGVAR